MKDSGKCPGEILLKMVCELRDASWFHALMDEEISGTINAPKMPFEALRGSFQIRIQIRGRVDGHPCPMNSVEQERMPAY
jgi:hypothetical protein